MSTWQCPDCGYSRNTTARKCHKCSYLRQPVTPIFLRPQTELLLNEAPTRRVKAVARTDSPLSDALFDIAAGQQRQWDLESWGALTDTLDHCNLRVDAWLETKEHG